MTEHGKAPGSSEAEQMAWRRGKLEGLRSQGWDFPNDFKRSCDGDGTEHTAALLQARYGDWEKAALEAELQAARGAAEAAVAPVVVSQADLLSYIFQNMLM